MCFVYREARALADRVYDIAVGWLTGLSDQRRSLSDKWRELKVETERMEVIKAEMEKKIEVADKAKTRLLAAVNAMEVTVTEEKKKQWLESPEARDRFQEQLDTEHNKALLQLNEELAQKDAVIAALVAEREQALADTTQKSSEAAVRSESEKVEMQHVTGGKDDILEGHGKVIDEGSELELRSAKSGHVQTTADDAEKVKEVQVPDAEEKRSSPALDMLLTAVS